MVVENPSILITDDDRDFRETLRGVFEPRGFRTLLAEDGEEALDILRTEPVHLALLDMHMPRLTGLETIRRLKRRFATLPCILISAGLDDMLLEQARDVQVYSALAKPVRFAELTRTVNEALRLTYGWPS